jgi:hypothetical protein
MSGAMRILPAPATSFVIATFAAVSLTASDAVAQTIGACFNQVNGNVRLVSGPAECRTANVCQRAF